MTNAEQINKYELTADQVIKVLGLDKKIWKAEKNSSTAAVKNLKTKKEYKNAQLYEWELYKKENGKWIKKKMDFTKFFKQAGYNNYAISGDNGLVIVQPYNLAKAEKITPFDKSENASGLSGNGGDVSGDFSGMDAGGYGAGGGVNYDVTGYKGCDENMVKILSFVKIQLLKECYEYCGILL